MSKPNRPGRPPTINDPHRTICAAAAALFSAKGYESASLQDVADAVGVTKAGLYHYFPTKQALFDAIVLQTLKDLHDGARAAIALEQTHDRRLRGFMRAHAGYFSQNGDLYRASFFGRSGGEMTNFTENQLAARKAYTALLEDLLGDGVRDGAFVVDDVATFARGLLGMLNWMARWYRPEGPKTAVEIADSYARTIMAGIARTDDADLKAVPAPDKTS